MGKKKENRNTKAEKTKFSRIRQNAIITSLVRLSGLKKSRFIRLPKLGLVQFAKSKEIKEKYFPLQSEGFHRENILFRS